MRMRSAVLSAALLLACSDATGPRDPVGSVFMPASVSVTNALVGITQNPAPIWIEFGNTAATAATAGFGVCAFAVEGYPTAARTGKPAWTQVLPLLGGCGPDILYSIEIPANGLALHTTLGSIDDDLIDQGPHLRLVYRRNGESFTRSIPVAWVEID